MRSMRRMSKKDLLARAFTHGCMAGANGHEMESCPFEDGEKRGAWFNGWRQGREIYIWIFKNHTMRTLAAMSVAQAS